MNLKKTISTIALGLTALVTLSACSEARAFDGEITYVVGNGAGDQATIKDVLLPGTTSSIAGDEIKHIVPGNQRNYTITDQRADNAGDRNNALIGYTKSDTEGQVGLPVKVEIQVFWGLNQNKDVLRNFYKFCSKYTCYSVDNNQDRSSLANSSTEGWNSMLRENFSPALDRATSFALVQFSATDLIGNPSNQAKLADAIASQFTVEIAKQYRGITPDQQFFCGNFLQTSDQTTACEPVQVAVQTVSYVDQASTDAANAQRAKSQQDATALENQKASAALALQQQQDQQAVIDVAIEQAKQKYGDDWQSKAWYIELAKACPTCSFYFQTDGTVVATPSK